jgi:glycosyltransferase involved in cell wall biosynthesis
MLSLHGMGDCFVLLHRSEGWGLPQFEACAMGKPVITTGYGGNLEFTKPDNSFLVGYKMIPVEGMGWIPWYTNGMSWADPDIKECGKYMRFVYANRGMADAMAQKARDLVLHKFSWESIGSEMKNRLLEIMKELRMK